MKNYLVLTLVITATMLHATEKPNNKSIKVEDSLYPVKVIDGRKNLITKEEACPCDVLRKSIIVEHDGKTFFYTPSDWKQVHARKSVAENIITDPRASKEALTTAKNILTCIEKLEVEYLNSCNPELTSSNDSTLHRYGNQASIWYK